MVNETRAYSDFQNLPWNSIVQTYSIQSTQIFLTLAPGKYELKLGGLMLADTDLGERRLVVGAQSVLSWNNSSDRPQTEQQDITLDVNLINTTQITGIRPGTIDAPPVIFRISYRSTPSLDLISKGELNKKNQEIKESLENASTL